MKRLPVIELLQRMETIRTASRSLGNRQVLKQAEDMIRALCTFDGVPKVTTARSGTNLTETLKGFFEHARSAPNVALFSCFVDGQPSAAIVAVEPSEDGFKIVPLFVSLNEHMHITDHDGTQPSHDGGDAEKRSLS